MSGNIVFTTADYEDSDDEDFDDVEEYEDNMETFSSTPSTIATPAGTSATPAYCTVVQPNVTPQSDTASGFTGQGFLSQTFQTLSNVVQHGAQMLQPQQLPTGLDDDVILTNEPNTPQTRQSGQEFVPLHRPPIVLETTNYLSEEQLNLWHDFFNVTPINSEDFFVEYSAYYSARRTLWNRGWVTITGFPGDGKRALAEHLLIKFVKKPERLVPRPELRHRNEWERIALDEEDREQYTVVTVNSYEEWRRKVNPNKKQCVLMDKIFGPATYTVSKVEEWINHLDEILETAVQNRPNTLVIITFQKHQLEKIHPRVTLSPLFQTQHVIDLTLDKYKPGNYDRMKILEGCCGGKHGLSYREQDEIEKANNNSYAYHSRLYAGVKSFHMEGQQYFKNPEKSVETVLQKVYSFDKIIYYTLACVGLLDGNIELDKERFEDYTEFQQNIFRQLRMALSVPDDVSLEKMRYACTLLSGVFLEPVQLHHWKFCHERMFFFVTDSVFRKIPQKILEICSLDFLNERIRTSSYFTITMESNLSVWNKDYSALSQRLVYEILRGNVRLIASHPSLCDVRFGEAFVKFMGEMGSLQPVLQQRGEYNRSFFFWVCYYGQDQTIKHLIKHDDFKDIKQQEWFKEELYISLFAACYGNGMNYGRIVKMLIEEGASMTATDPLPDEDFLVLYGQEIFDLVRKLKAPLLHVAAVYGSHDTMQSLIENGANVNEKTEDGFTVYHRAARNPDDGALRALLKSKPDINSIKSATGSLPIHEAIRCGGESATRQLHWSGSDIKDNYKMDDGRSMLAAATGVGIEGIVRTITNAMTKPKPEGCQDNWPALHTACAFGNLELVKTLLERDIPVNAKGLGGWTALHFAVLFNQQRIISMLLDKNADVNCQAEDKKTPLHIAAENGYWHLVDFLLDKKATPENTTKEGDFAITSAALNGHIEIVKNLIEEGIELEFPKERKEDPYERERMYRVMMMHARERERERERMKMRNRKDFKDTKK
ncbi:uncharacterized protein LOC133191852 [Saccostrea echinata]|uniref:uncharacterized protein LOC133191852 n=1 Tax=Saccostrea echinata TaxID=191078 RepID=UPI002A7F9E84|nr:uncharacterized protein LOC133191852 [Saccostrea echinata]